MNPVLFYLVAMNVAAFIVMFMDKKRARKNEWRIPEKTLFLLALLGGSIGSCVGMKVWHHKTKHWYFVYGMPLILILQVALFVFLAYKGIYYLFG